MTCRPLALTNFLPRWLTAAAVMLALSACGGGGSSPTPAPVPEPPPATLTLSGSSAQVLAGGKPVAMTAAASASAGTLNWTLGAGNPGSLSAASGAAVNYLPPAASAVSANTPVTITVSGTGVTRSFALIVYPDPGPAGLSLIAGKIGGSGQLDGAGTAARFLGVRDLASDAQGKLFVVGDQPIRAVSASGVVSTVLATPVGNADGPKTVARLNNPTSIGAGPVGVLYVLDANGIRQVDSSGSVVTLTTAFTNQGSANEQTQVLNDGAGSLLVMEYDRISKVSSAGVVSAFAGSRDDVYQVVDGQGVAAGFARMTDMTIDKNGNVFVVDAGTIRRISPSGAVTTLAGTVNASNLPALDGAGSAARFHGPLSIALDGDGNLLVLEIGEPVEYATPFLPAVISMKSMRKVTPAGVVTTIKTGLHRHTEAVRSDAAGRVFLLGRNQISLFGPDGSVVPFAGLDDDTIVDVDGRGAAASLVRPEYIAADPSGNLYVLENNAIWVDGQSERGLHLRRISPDGTVTTLSSRGMWWGKESTAQPMITDPSGIVIDRQGNLYISEKRSNTVHGHTDKGGAILKITPDGVASVFAGKHDTSTEITAGVDGVGEAARFGDATVLGFDADGNLYVNSFGIRKITPDRVVTTVAALPAGFGADADGNVYEIEGETVVRVAANGTRTVVAGVPGQRVNQLGALPGSLYVGGHIARLGPASFAITSGSAIIKLVLPH